MRLLGFVLLIHFFAYSQQTTFQATDISISNFIDGTLLIPDDSLSVEFDLAIIIGGSGPTDRNGNQNFLKNNSLKKLAEGLTKNGIATFRYDKRVVKQIRNRYVDQNLKFDDFITDAKSVIDYFGSSHTYNKIHVIGHGQGSLVGMVAAKDNADGFISIAGAGKPIDDVILEQIEKTSPQFSHEAMQIFDLLKQGQTTTNFPQALQSIFSLEIQPFMINWMQYNPQEEIKKLQMPILIINGTKDLQVPIEEAILLNKAAMSKVPLKLIDKMNHIMFIIEGDNLENSKSYNESFRELAPELIEAITSYINQ